MTGRVRTGLRALKMSCMRALENVVEGASRIALVNYPNIGNVGDPALWLGTMRLLRQLGRKPFIHVPIGELTGATIDHLKTADVVLINGGGNFGDLWEGQQQTREQILDVCSSQRIVQLPQSSWFENEQSLDRMVQLLAGARDVTLMWREGRSLEFARKALPGRHISAPDFALGLRRARRASSVEILCLIRDDKESRFPPNEWPDDEVAKMTDWTTDPLPVHPDLLETRELLDELLSDDPISPRVEKVMLDLARWRVDRGFDILGSGRVVVTDRLHGHIMALLLRRPHVILDNSYGKVLDLYRTWTSDAGLAVVAQTPSHALQEARSLLVDR